MRSTMTRRTASALLAAAAVSSVTRIARAADLIPFKIGISSPSVSILPVYFAEAGGFYEKQGLKTEIVNAEGGTRGIQVLLSGEIQAMHVGLAPVVQANLKDADLRLVAATINMLPFDIFATKKTSPALMKGATVGISTFGSETDIAVSVMLQKLGMTRDDVNITQIGGTTQRFGAMVAGRVDAAPLLEPSVTGARAKGFPEIIDLSAARTPWIFDAVVATRAYLKSSPDAMTRFLKAYIEGAMKGFGDEAWARDVIAKRFKTNDATVISSTYADFIRMTDRDLTPSAEGAKSVLAQLKAINLPVGSNNIDDYLDLSFINKIKADGFIDATRKQYNAK